MCADVLSSLYQGQCASVSAKSRDFDIRRRTKLGEPISPIIFNSVLEQVVRKVKAKWRSRKYGIQMGYGLDSIVTNLRFADHQMKQMITDVAIEGARVGLKLHPEKTKTQHNNIGYGSSVRNVNT